MVQKRNSYPFHVMFGRKPAEGERRTYEVITTTEEATNSTQLAENLITKLLKDERVVLEEGDHLVVAQITRVRGLKVTRTLAQVDEDPNEAFGETGETEIEERPSAPGNLRLVGKEEPEPEAPAAEATSEVELPDEAVVVPPAATPPPAPAEEASAPPPAVGPPPTSEQKVDDLTAEDPMDDMEPSVGDIVDDTVDETPAIEKPTKEEAPSEKAAADGDDPLDEIF